MNNDIKILSHAGILKEGDCGACCIGTIAGLSVQDVYDILDELRNINYSLVLTILQKLSIEYENWLPNYHMIDNREDWFPFGYPAHQNWMEWFKISQDRTNKKMIGIANINLNGKANIDPYADHWVLITVSDEGDKSINKMVNISCPTKGYYRVNAKDFLMMYGGYNTIWVYPKYNILNYEK